MAHTSYTKSVTTDFGGSFRAVRWEEQMGAETWTPPYLGSVHNGDTITVWFDGALPGGEVTTLDGLPAAHDASPPGEVHTTDATQTLLAHIPLAQNETRMLRVRVKARRTNGADRAVFYRRCCAYRETGSAALQGPVDTVLTRRSDVTWDVALAANGNGVDVLVTGAAGKDVTWDLISREGT